MIRKHEEKATVKPRSLLDHVSADVRRAIVKETHRLFPHHAHKMHVDPAGEIVFTSNPFISAGGVNNYTGAPLTLSQMVVLAAANLMRNDSQFVADLAEELAPAHDLTRWPVEEPGEEELRWVKEKRGWSKRVVRVLPPARNPDGSRPWHPSDDDAYAPSAIETL